MDEHAEVSWWGRGLEADVSRSSVFIRLLVRSVGLFKMEEDTGSCTDGAKQR